MSDSNLVDKVNIPELIKALRCREAEWGYYTKCEYYSEASDNRCARCDSDRLTRDAAAAIEELQAEVERLQADVDAAYALMEVQDADT